MRPAFPLRHWMAKLLVLNAVGTAIPTLLADSAGLCSSLSPKPQAVKTFYENNPTYVSSTLDENAWPSEAPSKLGMDDRVLERGVKYLNSLPQSLSFLVVRKGFLVKERYLHGSEVRHSNNIHSASKTLLGMLTGIALREGFLRSVDQPIADILSPKIKLSPEKKKITIRHLLTMSAGLDWTEDETEYVIETKKNWVQSILDRPLRTPVGSKWNYSSGLTHTLSAVLTEASGMSLCELADRYLFSRMGITFEHWGRDKQGYFSGGYNVYLKSRDLLKLGYLILNHGKWKNEQIVPRDWIEETTSTKIQNTHDYGYGYLTFLPKINGHQVYKMWGYGGQYVLIVPSLDLVTVVTADTKSEYAEMDAEKFLAKYIIPAVLSQRLRPLTQR